MVKINNNFQLHICITLLFSIMMLLLSCKPRMKVEYQEGDSAGYNGSHGDSLSVIVFQPQWLHQSQFAGYYVAHKKGYYKNLGLDVHITMGGPDRPAPEMLNEGKSDITTMFLTSALREWDEGKRIINLAQLSQKSAMLWVAKKNRGIEKIQDLNGKSVGLWYSDFREPSMMFINKHNLRIKEKPIGWTINLFLRDGIDAMNMMIYNEYDVLLNSGVKNEDLTVFALSDLGVDLPEDGIYCTEKYYKEHKKICEDFAEASLDGWSYALNNEEETLSIVLSYLKQAHLPANIPHQRWMLSKMKELILAKPSQFGKLTREDFVTSTQLMKENGFIKVAPDYTEFISDAHSKKN